QRRESDRANELVHGPAVSTVRVRTPKTSRVFVRAGALRHATPTFVPHSAFAVGGTAPTRRARHRHGLAVRRHDPVQKRRRGVSRPGHATNPVKCRGETSAARLENPAISSAGDGTTFAPRRLCHPPSVSSAGHVAAGPSPPRS